MEKMIDGKLYELTITDADGCSGCAFAIFSKQCDDAGIDCCDGSMNLSWKLKPTTDGKTN